MAKLNLPHVTSTVCQVPIFPTLNSCFLVPIRKNGNIICTVIFWNRGLHLLNECNHYVGHTHNQNINIQPAHNQSLFPELCDRCAHNFQKNQILNNIDIIVHNYNAIKINSCRFHYIFHQAYRNAFLVLSTTFRRYIKGTPPKPTIQYQVNKYM